MNGLEQIMAKIDNDTDVEIKKPMRRKQRHKLLPMWKLSQKKSLPMRKKVRHRLWKMQKAAANRI